MNSVTTIYIQQIHDGVYTIGQTNIGKRADDNYFTVKILTLVAENFSQECFVSVNKRSTYLLSEKGLILLSN